MANPWVRHVASLRNYDPMTPIPLTVDWQEYIFITCWTHFTFASTAVFVLGIQVHPSSKMSQWSHQCFWNQNKSPYFCLFLLLLSLATNQVMAARWRTIATVFHGSVSSPEYPVFCGYRTQVGRISPLCPPSLQVSPFTQRCQSPCPPCLQSEVWGRQGCSFPARPLWTITRYRGTCMLTFEVSVLFTWMVFRIWGQRPKSRSSSCYRYLADKQNTSPPSVCQSVYCL